MEENELDKTASVHDNEEFEQKIEEEDSLVEIEEEDGSAIDDISKFTSHRAPPLG